MKEVIVKILCPKHDLTETLDIDNGVMCIKCVWEEVAPPYQKTVSKK